MALVQSLSASDGFHRIVEDLIQRGGGRGNFGQLRVRLGPGLDRHAVMQAWEQVGQRVPLLCAPIHGGLRGGRFAVPRHAKLHAVASSGTVEALGHRDLQAGLASNEHVRLHLADDGVVLTWRHVLCDARGAQSLLAALATGFSESWWADDYRADRDVPATAAARGLAARDALPLLRPLRTQPMLRLRQGGRYASAPAMVHATVLGGATDTVDERIRSTVGRFGETAFCLAAVAGALAERGTGQIVFPLAVDLRKPGQTRSLSNAHGFMFLAVDAELARRDLAATARHLRDAHKAWVAADGTSKLLASLSWFPRLGSWFGRFQLGFGKPGLAASCCVANSGRAQLHGTWFGAEVRGVDHAAVVPGNPGLAVLFHRDSRGLGFDTVWSGQSDGARHAAQFAERVRWHLCERSLT
jgi:hypothetical protein